MNYYISDIHFGCQNRYEGRTLEHDQIIKKNWNSIVTNKDNVYILGDIGREGGNRDNEYLCEIISTLKGNKTLVKGNHEKLKDARLKQLFVEVCDYKEVTDCYKNIRHNLVLSHYPILAWNGQHKGWLHLYGHLHLTDEWELYKKSLSCWNDYFKDRTLKGYTDCPQSVAYNVGCMLPYMDYTPRTLEEIISKNSETSVDRQT